MASGPAAAIGLVVGAALTLPLLVGTTVAGFTWLIVPAAGLALLCGVLSYRIRASDLILPAMAVGAAAIGVYSILSGTLNGLSDEPYSTPAYAQLGLGMYSHPVVFGYTEYGRSLMESSYDVYLPLLTYLQVPGVDYRWVSLGAWGGSVYLLRADRFAAVAWASPWIATLAANGQNDFVPLLFVTLALARPPRRFRWLVEAVGLGLKQFANVLYFGYHLARREYLRAVATLAVTFLILLPFVWIDPTGVWCHVLIGDPTTSCQGHAWWFFVFKRNYWLYPTWVAAVYHARFRSAFRSVRESGARWRAARAPR